MVEITLLSSKSTFRAACKGGSVIAHYGVREAWRSRFFFLATVAVLCISLAGVFIASLTLTDTERFRTTLCASGLRFFAVFMMASLVVSSTQREINDKILELHLSLPLPRAALYIGRLLGFLACTVLLTALCTLPLFLHIPAPAVIAWGFALWLELLVVTSFALWIALSLSQTTTALAMIFAFYLVARMIADLQLINSAGFAIHGTNQQVLDNLLNALSLLLPRLDLLAHSGWLLGEANPLTLPGLAGQSLLYATLLLAAGLFDIYRKQW